MADNLAPITLTRKVEDIHSGGFSIEEEKALGFKEGELFEKPNELFELVTFHKKNFGRNLELYKEKFLKHNPDYIMHQQDVYLHTSTQVSENTIFNTKDGVIVIEKDVEIKPFSYIVGPMRICEGVTVAAHSYLRDNFIGKQCKVGGEIVSIVMEAYSNKTHHGCVADGYIGSWVNLGGGTSSSSLKNTYGKVKLNGKEIGENFIGPIIADYVKTAINTSIYTAKIIGVSSHVYGVVTEDIPSFTNYVFAKDNLIKLPLETAITIAERMCARRNITLSEEDKKVLSYAYTETESERKERGVKEGKLQF